MGRPLKYTYRLGREGTTTLGRFTIPDQVARAATEYQMNNSRFEAKRFNRVGGIEETASVRFPNGTEAHLAQSGCEFKILICDRRLTRK